MDSGTLFQRFGIAAGNGCVYAIVPIVFKLHDGIDAAENEAQGLTLVDKMADLCITYMSQGSYVVLDAYYASAKVLHPFRERGLHLISRVRISKVAHAAFSRCPGNLGRGRPRQWGSAIRLQDLFATSQTCLKAVVCL